MSEVTVGVTKRVLWDVPQIIINVGNTVDWLRVPEDVQKILGRNFGDTISKQPDELLLKSTWSTILVGDTGDLPLGCDLKVTTDFPQMLLDVLNCVDWERHSPEQKAEWRGMLYNYLINNAVAQFPLKNNAALYLNYGME